MPRSLGTMIEFDRCLSPIRGLSMRERREAGRGDVGCRVSDSEDEDEALEMEGDIEGRVGTSTERDAFIEAGRGNEAVPMRDDGELGIGCR